MARASLASRFWALPRADQLKTCEAAAILMALRIGARAAPRAWTASLLRAACAPAPRDDCSAEVAGIARAVSRAGRRIPGSTCLMQALAAWLMLRRREIRASVRLGVARADDRLAAHAWLEHAGGIVLGAESADGFTGFPPPP